MGCSSHMRDHFKGPSPHPKAEYATKQQTSEPTDAQLQPNWGKQHAEVEPIASPNQAPGDGLPTDGVKEVAEATLPGSPSIPGGKEHRADPTR